MQSSYLQSAIKQFEYYKELGDKTLEQLNHEELKWQHDEFSNSIIIIIKHLVGNMTSRWTNFLNEDGEKLWRNRDDEFIDSFANKDELLENWNKGWDCLFNAVKTLNENDLEKIIFIRNQAHTVTEAINRQLSHYAYHVGQMVFIGKLIKGNEWKSLSIPIGESVNYNKEKFSKTKSIRHFTDDL